MAQIRDAMLEISAAMPIRIDVSYPVMTTPFESLCSLFVRCRTAKFLVYNLVRKHACAKSGRRVKNPIWSIVNAYLDGISFRP